MGRKKKKKDVIRCGVCGVKATYSYSSVVHLCNNLACQHTLMSEIKAIVLAHGGVANE